MSLASPASFGMSNRLSVLLTDLAMTSDRDFGLPLSAARRAWRYRERWAAKMTAGE
jgi:hypothetical protein